MARLCKKKKKKNRVKIQITSWEKTLHYRQHTKNFPKYFRKKTQLTKEKEKNKKRKDRKFTEEADLKGQMLSLTSHHRNAN